MPVNVVRTREEEIAWERAKARAREEYPDATGDRFYRIVMAIYKKIAHYQPHSFIVTDRAAAEARMR
jgi:thymidylate kinase